MAVRQASEIAFNDAVRYKQGSFAVSEQVQAIVEAVRGLGPEQFQELRSVLAAMDAPSDSGQPDRKQLVNSIRGKYRHVPTTSESFMRRKMEDLELESQS